jgi:hypothetical protein
MHNTQKAACLVSAVAATVMAVRALLCAHLWLRESRESEPGKIRDPLVPSLLLRGLPCNTMILPKDSWTPSQARSRSWAYTVLSCDSGYHAREVFISILGRNIKEKQNSSHSFLNGWWIVTSRKRMPESQCIQSFHFFICYQCGNELLTVAVP